MEKKHMPDFERMIEDSLQTALKSGDFSGLRHMMNDTLESIVEKTITSTVSGKQAVSKAFGQNWTKRPESKGPYVPWNLGKVWEPVATESPSQGPNAEKDEPPSADRNSEPKQNTPNTYTNRTSGWTPPPQGTRSAHQTSQVKRPTEAPRTKQPQPSARAPGNANATKSAQTAGLACPPYVKRTGWDKFLGGFLTFFGFMGAIPIWTTAVVLLLQQIPLGIRLGPAVGCAALIASAIVFTLCAFHGIRRYGRARRFKCYWNLVKDKGFCSITDLAQGVGKSPRFVVRDLVRVLAEGLLPQGKLDDQRTCLICGDALYQQYLETVTHAKIAHDSEKNDNPVIAAGLSTIRQIRAANAALPEVVITEKLDRLEDVTTGIFAYVEQRPAKLPDIRRFMDYYLPSTLKLVNTYQDFEKQSETPSTAVAKKEILATLDTVNQAFETLLDGLYQDDAMDVSTDISVLKTMLAQEGLTEDEFGKGNQYHAG